MRLARATPHALLAPLAVWAAAPVSARAQQAGTEGGPPGGVDAHHLQLAAWDGDLRDPLLVQRAGRLHAWDAFGGGVLEYANRPLVRYELDASGAARRSEIVDHLVTLNLSGGVALHERLRLDLAVPIYLGSVDANDRYQGVDLGDMRLTAMVPLVLPDPRDEGLGLAAVAQLDVPTGAARDFLGSRSVGGGGKLVTGFARGAFAFSAELGVHFQPKVALDNVLGSDVFRGGLGVSVRVHPTTSVVLEGLFDAPFQAVRQEVPRVGTQTPAELVASVRHRRPQQVNLVVGGAAGLTPGVGAPRFRLFVGAGYGKITPPPPEDTDGDGLRDDVDACPTEPETFNGYLDEDGCPDALAALRVRATLDGAPIAGADVAVGVAEGSPEPWGASTVDGLVRGDLTPGARAAGRASWGACLVGEGEVTLASGDNALDLGLRPSRPARVVYEVVDPQGRAVPDVVASWKTSSAGCADAQGYALGPDGRMEHPIGVGTHAVVLDAPGFRPHQEEVVLRAGDVRVIRVTLTPERAVYVNGRIQLLERVLFETDSACLQPDSYALLEDVASLILNESLGRVRIEGHTDSRGSEAHNLDLSARRAEAVRAYLVARGVPAAALEAVGFGESKPIAPNDTDVGRAQNRRVNFEILGPDGRGPP
jgi:outer membrane protein OmpA-like peptidoglycan-associated protein